jgi:hypothetical protein
MQNDKKNAVELGDLRTYYTEKFGTHEYFFTFQVSLLNNVKYKEELIQQLVKYSSVLRADIKQSIVNIMNTTPQGSCNCNH